MKISVSRLKCFESCRFAYKFKYLELLEPVKKADALVTGSNYHQKLEQIYKDGYCLVDDFSKESAMALAYEKYVYPVFKVKAVEEWFEYPFGKNQHTLVGRVDGVTDDGVLVEHKTTGTDDLEEYEYNLQWDEQIMAYMLGYNVRKMWYTVIRKPTIKQKKTESDEEFFDRMCKWYDEETERKIKVIEVERTDEQIEEFKEHLEMMADMMENAEFDQKFLYRNPLHCNCWGRRCEYSSICLNYDPNVEYVDFIKGEKRKGEEES